jgi:hypothetical protein
MTADEFRTLVLSLPETSEDAHMGHPDFRVRGKIFATLWPDDDWGMVKLTVDQQGTFVRSEPRVFQPVKGAWGRRGCTRVHLPQATEDRLWPAMVAAWRNIAPKRLREAFDEE